MSSGQIVIFKLEEHEFGIDIKKVVEILNYEEVRSVPEVPRYVEGIINVRGLIYPIFNLRKRLKMEEEEQKQNSKFILLQLEKHRVGFQVDHVTEILTVNEEWVEQPPTIIDCNKINCMEYIVKQEQRMVIVLDVKALISEEDNLFVQGVSNEKNYCSNAK